MLKNKDGIDLMLKNKTVLITGGASGIGLASANLMYEAGARVAITGRDQPKLDKARAAIGDDLLTLQGKPFRRKTSQYGGADQGRIRRAGCVLRQCRAWHTQHHFRIRPKKRSIPSWIRTSSRSSSRFGGGADHA